MAKKKNFWNIINGDQPVLVDFHATWCGPCKAMMPILKDAAKDLSGDVKILKIDIDKNPAVAKKFKIRSVPTMILFEKGAIKWQKVGGMTKHQLVKTVRSKVK